MAPIWPAAPIIAASALVALSLAFLVRSFSPLPTVAFTAGPVEGSVATTTQPPAGVIPAAGVPDSGWSIPRVAVAVARKRAGVAFRMLPPLLRAPIVASFSGRVLLPAGEPGYGGTGPETERWE